MIIPNMWKNEKKIQTTNQYTINILHPPALARLRLVVQQGAHRHRRSQHAGDARNQRHGDGFELVWGDGKS